MKFFLLRVVLIPFVFVACFACTSTEESSDVKLSIVDGRGKEINLSAYPQKVISLAPSVTETLALIIPDSFLIAKSTFCDLPIRYSSKKTISTYPKLDVEELVRLSPDLIVTHQGITSEEDIFTIEKMGIPVYVCHFTSFDKITDGIKTLATLFQQEQRAAFVADSLHSTIQDITVAATPKKVLCIVSNDPVYVFGHNTLFTEKLEKLGHQNAVTMLNLSDDYPLLDKELLLRINPDVILGDDFDTMEATFFTIYPELRQINAYYNKQIYEIDRSANSRPGPGSFASLLEINRILQLIP